MQKTFRPIEKCKHEENILGKNDTLDKLNSDLDKLRNRLKSYIDMKADGEITGEEYKETYNSTKSAIEELEDKIVRYELEPAKRQNKLLNMDNIEKLLNSYVDLEGYKVSDDATGSGQKYRIPCYDPEYAKLLNDDSQFDVVTKFIIPVEECKDYCMNVLHRKFVPKYWKNIIVKIAVC